MSTNYSRCNSVVCCNYYTCKRAQMTSNTEPTDYANYWVDSTRDWACGHFGNYKMYEPMTLGDESNVISISRDLVANSSIFNLPPTHQCTICEELENPESNIIDSKFWLCPTCLKKLKFVLSNVVIKKEDRVL